MKTIRSIMSVSWIVCVLAGANAEEALTLRAEYRDTGVDVHVGDALFTHYRTARDWKYPYFYPVNGPLSGTSVTTETSEPYPHHHSLFFGCDRVNGGNYWQEGLERGQIISNAVQLVRSEGSTIVIKNNCRWERPDAEAPFEDERTIVITAPSETARWIDFTITLTALIDVKIEKTNHSLFSARMAPALSVTQGGTLINAEGLKNEKGTFGQRSRWCDYYGPRSGHTEGLAIQSHPSNRWHPEPWFTRDYGFFSPTPMFWLDNDVLRLSKGERLTFRYLAVAHAGSADEAGIEAIYQRWITMKSNGGE